MERPQERFARQLYNEMTRQVAPAKRGVQVSIEGAGVNWRVSVALLERSSTVHCFAVRDEVPEFLTILQSWGKEIATARTSSMEWTVRAVFQWLESEDLTSLYLTSLYKTFDFVVHCHWDGCELFKFHAADQQFLGNLLKRWLCDEVKPSEMRKEFPALSIGKLADYYEQGKPIEGEFIDSWDHIEQFYDQVRFPLKPRVLELIKHLREAGYDETLRAGQSMFTFILSRSRRHGLRADQACITIQFQSSNEMNCTVKTGEQRKTFVSANAPSDLLTTSLDQLAGTRIE